MGSALLHPETHGTADACSADTLTESTEELRSQVAQRLAAHRERRLRKEVPSAAENTGAAGPQGPKARIAAAVAERYANAQSYRAFLAAEAERSVQRARAAAEVAARNAQAVAEAQQRLLESLAAEQPQHTSAGDQRPEPGAFTEQALWPDLHAHLPDLDEPPSPVAAAEPAAVRVVLYDNLPTVALGPAPASERRRHRDDLHNDPEALALDEEISFRQAPVFEEPPGPPMPLPANLIEFPRHLVASRKARPRYAEGPLRDEDSAPEPTGQLRIFEVSPAQISTTPDLDLAEPAAPPEAQWTSLWLDAPGHAPAHTTPAATVADIAEPASYASYTSHTSSTRTLHTAAIPRRLLAAAIDLAITAVAGLGCAVASAATSAALAGQTPWRLAALRAVASGILHAVPPATLAITGVAAAVFLSVLLQVVCFTFSDATPGMRLARVGLCTFNDENPTRAAMRRRIPALLLSTALLGLGFVWALLDEHRLTWHDLISRMYQRSY